MKKIRTWEILILFVLAAALAFGLEWLQVATQPKQYEPEPVVVREAGEIDFSACELTEAEVKKDYVSTEGEGAAIVCDFGAETEIPMLQVLARKHLKADVPIRIFYAKDGEDFAPERSVAFTADTDSVFWQPEFPAGRYRKLRFEVDGKMSIKSIVYSEEVLERTPIPEGMNVRRALLLGLILFPVLLFLRGVHAGKRLAEAFRHAWHGAADRPLRTLVHAGIFLAAGCAGYFAAKWMFLGSPGAAMNGPRHAFCAAAGLVAACLLTFRKTLGLKPEILYVVISLCAGSLMVFFYADTTLVSLDDAYHFEQSLNFSYLGEKRVTRQDFSNILEDMNPLDGYVLGEERDAWLRRQQEAYAEGVQNIEKSPLETKNFWDIFPGTGLFLGRVLGLSYYWVFCMGKLFNLLAYTVCGYFAVKRLRSGKMIAALTLLIPTSMFLASSYSYDPGLNGFMTLGMAYWIAEWQEADKKLTWGRAGIMAGSMVFGGLVKAIYFPMLLLPLLLPGSKFARKGEKREPGSMRRWAFYALMAVSILALLLTFMVPLLTGGAEGDERAGDSIDAYGQITFILQHPFEYAGILLEHLKGYFSPGNAVSTLSLFGYMGYGAFTAELSALLLFAAFTDRRTCDARMMKSAWRRALGLFLLFGTVCGVSSSMYITFTGVGESTIGGVQPRYMLPLIFPVLMQSGPGLLAWMGWRTGVLPVWARIPLLLALACVFLKNVFPELRIGNRTPLAKLPRIDGTRKQALYNGLVFAGAAYILFSGVFDTCISKYIG